MINSQRMTFVLLILIIISSLAVIGGSYHSRQKFISLQELLKKSQQYDVEWGQLLIEKSTLGSYLGVENVAKDQLDMTFPVRKQIVIVEADKK